MKNDILALFYGMMKTETIRKNILKKNNKFFWKKNSFIYYFQKISASNTTRNINQNYEQDSNKNIPCT